jgi:methyl-accepting chemotaxis protein
MAADQENRQDRERMGSQAARLRWLIALRWVALGGIALAGMVTQLAGYSLFSATAGWWLAPPGLLYNLAFLFWVNRVERAPWPLARVEHSLRAQARLQPLCDIVFLTALVYLNSGVVACPIYFVPLLAVMISSVVLPRSEVFLLANVGTILFGGIALAEYQAWIPHITFVAPGYDAGLHRDAIAVLSRVISMAAGLNLVAFLMSNLGQRLNQTEGRTRRRLAQLREQVAVAAGRLSQAAAGLQSGAAEVSQVAGQITTTVHQIAQGAGQQADQLGRLSRSLEDVTSAADRVAADTQETHRASTQIVATAERGREAAREAITRMDEISHVFARSEEAMLALARRSDEIAEIAAAIDRFAERTDLLALNAGIEAARAGEHGRGFAVVAGEVKKLAASSSASAERVAEMVAQVQAEIAEVVRSVQAGEERVRDGREAIAALQEALDGMAAVIARTDQLAAAMEALSQQQREGQRESMRAVGEIAIAAEESAAGAEETAAAVEQQTASFSEFTQAAQNMAELAARLDRAVTGLTSDGAQAQG